MRNLKPGDIILVYNGKSFIARGIQLFMRIYKRKRKIITKQNYHHNGTIITIWGLLHVAEAIGKGYTVQALSDAYSQKSWDTRIDVHTPKKPYTIHEQDEISKLAVNYSLTITPYDKLNFLFQIWLILTGRWIGPRGKKAENRFYCSEATATLANKIRPGTFALPAATNPVDVAMNENYILMSFGDKKKHYFFT